MNPTLRSFLLREAREGRRVTTVTGSRLLDRDDMRPLVQSVLRRRLSELRPTDLYISGGCEGSPDVWGHRIAYEVGVVDHLMLMITGQFRFYRGARLTFVDRWDRVDLRPSGPNRNYAMIEAATLLYDHGCDVEVFGCQAKWAPKGGTGHTLELAESEKLRTVRAVFYYENDQPSYSISRLEAE